MHALYRAYFQEARNVHDGEVLADVAAPHGFSPEEVARLIGDEGELAETREAARGAAAAGIHGVPFFVFGERLAVAGAQPEEVLRRRPDVVIASWCGKAVRPERIAARAGWEDMPAVRDGHIYEVKSAYILQPGPAALTDGLRQLCEILARVRPADGPRSG